MRTRRSGRDEPFDGDSLEPRLVWIWGSPRSGSTWLLEQLCHPLKPNPKAAVGFDAQPRQGPLDAIPIDESFIPNHLAPAFGDPLDVEGTYVPGTLNNYLGDKPAYALSREYEAVWRPELRRFALVRIGAVLDRASREGFALDEPLVVIKEVNGSHASDLIMSLLPRSRAIFLVRDGRDVVDSLLSAYQPGGFFARNQGRTLETREEREEGVRWASLLWSCNVDITRRALASHPPALQRTVRYEDLLADTAGGLAALFDWLGLARDEARQQRIVAEGEFSALPAGRRGPGKRRRAASPGLWRHNLSAEEQRLASEIMGSRLASLGYGP